LIIDDEPDIRSVLGKRLRDRDYKVITAVDGEEGLKKIETSSPDLVILDVLMPKIGGFELFKILREKPAHKNIPVIVLSARSSMRATFEALNVERFISKPFDTEELLDLVDYLLTKKVLLLTKESHVIRTVEESFEKYGYMTEVARSETELADRLAKIGYEAIVVHIPYLKMSPERLVSMTDNFRNPSATIIVFCDPSVQGTEDDDTVAIDRYRLAWKNIGVTYFFDQRTTAKDFRHTIKDWI